MSCAPSLCVTQPKTRVGYLERVCRFLLRQHPGNFARVRLCPRSFLQDLYVIEEQVNSSLRFGRVHALLLVLVFY